MLKIFIIEGAKIKRRIAKIPINISYRPVVVQALCAALPGLLAPRFCPTSIAEAWANPNPGIIAANRNRMHIPYAAMVKVP